MVIKL